MEPEATGYVRQLLEAYLALPDTPARCSRYDRSLALQLHQQGVPLDTVRDALVLAAARRLLRDPELPPLAPIRSLHYFRPVIEEISAQPLPRGYIQYCRCKIQRALANRMPAGGGSRP